MGVPKWYIDSLAKDRLSVPQGPSPVAYVMMAFRIAWFKVHEPLAFYSAYFYRKSQKGGFDAAMMTQGLDEVKRHIAADPFLPRRHGQGRGPDDHPGGLLYGLDRRGFEFAPLDIYRSHATKFLPEDGRLRTPFVAVSGLGEKRGLG